MCCCQTPDSNTNLVGVNNNVESRGESYQEVAYPDDNHSPQWSVFPYWSIAHDMITLLNKNTLDKYDDTALNFTLIDGT